LQSNLVWSGIVLGKVERFYVIQKLIDRRSNQNVLISSAYYRNEKGTISLVLKLTKKKNFGLWNNQLQKWISQKLIQIFER
jgi:hypothetical protein